jgi:hypothetical protein
MCHLFLPHPHPALELNRGKTNIRLDRLKRLQASVPFKRRGPSRRALRVRAVGAVDNYRVACPRRGARPGILRRAIDGPVEVIEAARRAVLSSIGTFLPRFG